jgi:ABC-2 type transport system ATP-binding protein
MTTASAPTTQPIPEAGTTGSPAIVARGLTKRYGRTTAVDHLSFEVRPGRVTGFLGPNGAGKSTTLRMLLGLVRPSGGDATVLGFPYASLDRPTHAVGAVLEAHSFHPQRSGRNHLRVMARAAGIPQSRVDDVLEQVGLTEVAGDAARRYSLGMRQRLGLATALLGEPSVLVLDEPANGLDPQGMRWLRQFLVTFAERGNAVLVSSHLLAEVAQMADDVIVIHHGRLARHGPVTELTADTAALVATPRPEQLSALLEAAGMAVRRDSAGRLTVQGGSAERIGTLAADAGIPLFELATQNGTLEDVFLELTNEQVTR